MNKRMYLPLMIITAGLNLQAGDNSTTRNLRDEISALRKDLTDIRTNHKLSDLKGKEITIPTSIPLTIGSGAQAVLKMRFGDDYEKYNSLKSSIEDKKEQLLSELVRISDEQTATDERSQDIAKMRSFQKRKRGVMAIIENTPLKIRVTDDQTSFKRTYDHWSFDNYDVLNDIIKESKERTLYPEDATSYALIKQEAERQGQNFDASSVTLTDAEAYVAGLTAEINKIREKYKVTAETND